MHQRRTHTTILLMHRPEVKPRNTPTLTKTDRYVYASLSKLSSVGLTCNTTQILEAPTIASGTSHRFISTSASPKETGIVNDSYRGRPIKEPSREQQHRQSRASVKQLFNPNPRRPSRATLRFFPPCRRALFRVPLQTVLHAVLASSERGRARPGFRMDGVAFRLAARKAPHGQGFD